jgi:hypothetical protein
MLSSQSPQEITRNIIRFLDIDDLVSLRCTSQFLWSLTGDSQTLSLLIKIYDLRLQRDDHREYDFKLYVVNYIAKYLPKRSLLYPRDILENAIKTDDAVAYINITNRINEKQNIPMNFNLSMPMGIVPMLYDYEIVTLFDYSHCEEILEYLAFGKIVVKKDLPIVQQGLVKTINFITNQFNSVYGNIDDDLENKLRYIAYHDLQCNKEDLIFIYKFEVLLWQRPSCDILHNHYSKGTKQQRREMQKMVFAYDRIDFVQMLDSIASLSNNLSVFHGLHNPTIMKSCGPKILIYCYNNNIISKDQLYFEVRRNTRRRRLSPTLEMIQIILDKLDDHDLLFLPGEAISRGDYQLLDWLMEHPKYNNVFKDMHQAAAYQRILPPDQSKKIFDERVRVIRHREDKRRSYYVLGIIIIAIIFKIFLF